MADSKKYNGSTWEHSLRKLTTSTDNITTLPVDVYADGNNATVVISGNMEQSGTPTPDNPIMPEGCGERTENLFPLDESKLHVGRIENDGTIDYEIGTLTVGTDSVTYEANTAWRGFYTDFIQVNENENLTFSPNNSSIMAWVCNCYDENGGFLGNTSGQSIGLIKIFTLLAGTKKVRISVTSSNTSYTITKPMLNLGSTALPYEPWGIKIPISSANTTTPVYLGEVESTRAIIKKVLDGTETAWTSVTVQGRMSFNWKTETQNPTGANVLCTHYKSEYAVREGVCFITTNNVSFIDSNFQSLDDFKNFLADEYAAGHPVTIWYVQNTPTTGIVNELLMKIGNYADTVSGITVPTITGKDTFDIETTLKPSEVSLSYTGWHDATVKERDGSQWNE